MKIASFIRHRILRLPHILPYSDEGTGETIVLLHGIGGNKEVWEPLIVLLKTRYRVVSIDLLGFGEAPTPRWVRYTVRDHTKSVLATLKKLRINQPVAFVGHSMGGLVATHIGAKYPHAASRLVLYAPPLFADAPEYKAHMRARKWYFRFFRYVAAHPGLAMLQWRTLWRIFYWAGGLDLDQEKWLPFERSLRNTIMEQSAYKELSYIVVPTDIIQGRLDFVVIRNDVRRMFAGNKNITIHVVNRMHNITPRAAKLIYNVLCAPHEARGVIREKV